MELDPRYLIAKDTNFADHEIAGGWHAVNLALAVGAHRSRRDRLLALRSELGAEGRIDQAHVDAPADLGVATAVVTAAGLQRLEALALEPENGADKILRRFEYAQVLKPPRIRPVPALSLPKGITPDSTPEEAPPERKGVRDVFAVIDHGCPFMHPLLCTQLGAVRSTRVRALWDQQPRATRDARTKPKGFDYGTELSRTQLDAVIRAAAGSERLAYESLGYETLRRRESHGAHSLGMLLDDGRRPRGAARGGTPEDILFVQLPQGLLSAPYRAGLARFVIDALVWIESHRAADERVILSLGRGSSQGPNDGSSIVEQALRTFTQWGPRGGRGLDSTASQHNRVYIAAGNGHNERLHAEATVEPSEPVSFLWRVPPASELPASVEIWLPAGANGSTAQVQVEVIAPDGRPVARVTPGRTVHWPQAGAAAVSVASTAWRGDRCTSSLIRLAPTAATAVGVQAPGGDWTITLTTKTALTGPVHLFIGRVKPALGFPLRAVQSTFVFNRQSGFVDASGQGTLQGLATAEGVIRVGGVVGTPYVPKPAPYSSRGPSRNGAIEGPDLSVRVDDGSALQGRRSIGNVSGVSFRMNGTSVGAPLAARMHRAIRHKPRPHPKDPEAIGEVLQDPHDT